jgi:inorganic triphosphatase YgiF
MSRTAPAEPRRASREVEVSLVISSEDPEETRRRLARLRKVDGYALRARGSERIVDRYFDTPDRSLRSRWQALRLRTTKDGTLIGLKGRARSASTRTEDRFELERPLSAQAIEEVRRRLRLSAARDAASVSDTDPDAVVEATLGVRLIQRRETHRLLRDVTDGRDAAGAPLAELALDRVRFSFDGREVTHYEVEVEAKQTGRGTKAVRVVASELRSRYPDELFEWPYGKLPTGAAIEALLASGELARRRSEKPLAPEAYERIRVYIANHSD